MARNVRGDLREKPPRRLNATLGRMKDTHEFQVFAGYHQFYLISVMKTRWRFGSRPPRQPFSSAGC